MRVTVTGGCGYIGSVLVDLLLAEGHEVQVIDNMSACYGEGRNRAAMLCEYDVRSREYLASAFHGFEPEIVYHLAAEATIDSPPGSVFDNNVAGGLNLLHAMERVGCKKIVFASSAAVYGAAHCGKIDEETRCAPISPYGESKFQFERILHWFGSQAGLQHVSLRLFNVCGATATRGELRKVETHIIPTLFMAAGLGWRFKMRGNATRDYVHVFDVARAFLWAGNHLTNTAYNVCTGKGTSNVKVMSMVSRGLGNVPIDFEDALPRIGDPPRLVGDPRKLWGDGCTFYQHDVQAMINHAITWYKKQ